MEDTSNHGTMEEGHGRAVILAICPEGKLLCHEF